MCNSNAKAARETKTNTGTTMNDTHKIGNRSKYKIKSHGWTLSCNR
jgi:hypothetical protein